MFSLKNLKYCFKKIYLQEIEILLYKKNIYIIKIVISKHSVYKYYIESLKCI